MKALFEHESTKVFGHSQNLLFWSSIEILSQQHAIKQRINFRTNVKAQIGSFFSVFFVHHKNKSTFGYNGVYFNLESFWQITFLSSRNKLRFFSFFFEEAFKWINIRFWSSFFCLGWNSKLVRSFIYRHISTLKNKIFVASELLWRLVLGLENAGFDSSQFLIFWRSSSFIKTWGD